MKNRPFYYSRRLPPKPAEIEIKPFRGPDGQKGKDVSGMIELFLMGIRIDFERYSSRKHRSQIIEQWRESIGTPYHSNEYFIIIKNDL